MFVVCIALGENLRQCACVDSQVSVEETAVAHANDAVQIVDGKRVSVMLAITPHHMAWVDIVLILQVLQSYNLTYHVHRLYSVATKTIVWGFHLNLNRHNTPKLSAMLKTDIQHHTSNSLKMS
jgi:hypothetical protein